MRKQVILSLFLLTILMGQAVAIPIIVPILAGVAGGTALGYIIGNYVHIPWLQTQETGDTNIDYVNYKTVLINNAKTHERFMTTYKNLAEYVKYYALARAKAVYAIEVAKGLNNSTDPNSVLNDVLTNAMYTATDTALETIDNATRNIVEYWNDYVGELGPDLASYIGLAEDLGKDPGISPQGDNIGTYKYNNEEVGTDYYVLVIDGNEVDTVYLDGLKLYDRSEFEDIIQTLKESRDFVEDNLITYFEDVNQKVLDGEINISELANEVIDPYALLTMAQNNSTNSLVWAQYSLALMGLQTNITAPITVKVGNETYEGYIFASYPTNFEVGHNYTVPDDQAVFILTSDGKLVTLQPGDSFELVRAIDEKTGKELDNINMTSFTPASFNASAYDEELRKLIELQKEILDKLTTTGGGSDWADKINDFWNGLDWQVKAFIVGGGILVAVILIGRSFGRGGVSVIRVEEPRK